MQEIANTRHHTMRTYKDGSFQTAQAEVATEYPITIIVNNEEFATIVCTPSDLQELVIGFMASEGVIASFDEIQTIAMDDAQGMVYVELHQRSAINPALFSKRRIASCCGKSRQSFYFHSDARTAKKVQSQLRLSPEQCILFMNTLAGLSVTHHNTGGVHNAALFSDGEIIVQYFDIGRHNALDKIFGTCLIRKVPADDKTLVISGRISSEMVLKAAKIGSPILLSKSAPTELALQLAGELGITTVGFIRNGSLNVYTYPERILNA